MARFEVQGKEYELKITFDSIKHLNGLHQGGAMELIGKVFTGDLDTFVNIVYASLFHTEKNFTLKTIEKEVETLFIKGTLDLDFIVKTGNELISNSFFYKKMVEKMLAQDPRAAKQMKQILN